MDVEANYLQLHASKLQFDVIILIITRPLIDDMKSAKITQSPNLVYKFVQMLLYIAPYAYPFPNA